MLKRNEFGFPVRGGDPEDPERSIVGDYADVASRPVIAMRVGFDLAASAYDKVLKPVVKAVMAALPR